MYPVKLTIEGLYSYQKSQTIDFEELTVIGLFGIFGPTGSGKSSILEAISLALYGETERLNNRDNRNYNVMNLKSEHTFIEFDFKDHQDQLYRATYELKRNSKNFEDVRSPSRIFYKWGSNSWEPLEHADAEKILELSYENFKRTIIIPQGKFQDFIDLTPANRTSMLMEIFDLNRFDLSDKTNILKKEAELKLSGLAGQLRIYAEISENQLMENQKRLEEISEKFINRTAELKKRQEEFRDIEKVKSISEKLDTQRNALEKQAARKAEMDNKEQELNEYERVQLRFLHPVKALEGLKQSLILKQTDLALSENELEKKQLLLAKNNEDLKAILPYFTQLDEKKQTVTDLEQILLIKDLSLEKEKLRTRIEKGSAMVTESETQVKNLKHFIQNTEEEIEKLKETTLGIQLLIDISRWFDQSKNLQKNIEEKVKRISHLQAETNKISKSISKEGKNIDDYKQSLLSRAEALSKEANALAKSRSHLVLHQKLSEYANELRDGSPCPLCGSIEHPKVPEVENVDADIENIDVLVRNNEAGREKLRNEISELDKKTVQLEEAEKNISEENRQLQTLKDSEKIHLGKFIWPQFDDKDPEQFEKQKNKSNKISEEIKLRENSLKAKRAELEKEEEKFVKCRNGIEKLVQEKREKETSIRNYTGLIKILSVADYSIRRKDEILSRKISIEQKNKKTEADHKKLTEEKAKLSETISGLVSSVNEKEKNIAEIKTQIQKSIAEIDQLLQNERGKNIDDIRTILSKEMDTKAIKSSITAFNINLKAIKTNIKELEKELGDRRFKRELFDESEKLVSTARALFDQINIEKIEIEKDIKGLEEKLKEKKELQQNLLKVEKRFQNLQVLADMFKAKGFVKYVSTFFLQQLCQLANQRFSRMTRNQLTLQLSDNNDFEVIDMLNDGRRRSVKTLSGGQLFQVSLSLALALAGNVQSHAKAKNNFFFIDEGFGTQDHESVQIVFDTLLSLNREHKSVGIISHVDELKEMVPAALIIQKDTESGSVIYKA